MTQCVKEKHTGAMLDQTVHRVRRIRLFQGSENPTHVTVPNFGYQKLSGTG